MKSLKGPSKHGYHSGVPEMFRCWQEYLLKYVRKIRIPGVQTPEPLAIGLRVHAGRARWFGSNFAQNEATWTSIKKAMLEEGENTALPLSESSLRFAQSIMEQFIEHWGRLPKPKVLAAEVEASTQLGEHPRTNRLDDISVYPGATQPMPGECKTTSGGIVELATQYKMHGQLLHQMVVLRGARDVVPRPKMALPPMTSVMLDIIKKGYGGKRHQFARVPINFTERSISWFAESLEKRLDAASTLDWNSKVQRSPACVRKEGNMTVECPFLRLCNHGRSAAGQYVTEDGMRLTDWAQSPGRETPPWD
jgi:hypothetical protein